MQLKALYVLVLAASLSLVAAAPFLGEGSGELLPACSFKRDSLGNLKRECDNDEVSG
ncbi:hypothetical protein EXIGLDRAFT_839901 [Exidia glandulosa HHB12029]|uniref:Uncharacterized protein n=1 Tax=Exidia glandulosa HHB12029 TaxID=1314781 RepID=A0A165EQP2_EXIGL|nr:hypothetical protein EXIGLDRAFT_839901 [Exidia glandulosa HHB12029]